MPTPMPGSLRRTRRRGLAIGVVLIAIIAISAVALLFYTALFVNPIVGEWVAYSY